MESLEVNVKAQGICGVSKKDIERVVSESLLLSGIQLEKKNITVAVVEVKREEMQRLNFAYRGKNKPTDVLSFPEYADRQSIENAETEELSLGDVLLCCEVVDRQAEEDGVSRARECIYLLSHGVLHLLGYNHEPEQFSIQDKICDILEKRVRDEK